MVRPPLCLGAILPCTKPRTSLTRPGVHPLVARRTSMHVEPGNRKRRKAPKVRTGCTQCKEAHIKCCESKPNCRRCKTLGKLCKYDPVRAWNCESGSRSPAPKAGNAPLQPSKALQLQWLPTEDRHAMDHYIHFTGPWIANYAPPQLRQIWEATRPTVRTCSSCNAPRSHCCCANGRARTIA